MRGTSQGWGQGEEFPRSPGTPLSPDLHMVINPEPLQTPSLWVFNGGSLTESQLIRSLAIDD